MMEETRENKGDEMKAMTILLAVALVASAALNMFLWKQNAQQRAELEAVRASAAEVESVRAENETLKKQSAAQSPAGEAESRELARLRNRDQSIAQASSGYGQTEGGASSRGGAVRTQLTSPTTQHLAQKGKGCRGRSQSDSGADGQMQQSETARDRSRARTI
jgi:hypothetical protein